MKRHTKSSSNFNNCLHCKQNQGDPKAPCCNKKTSGEQPKSAQILRLNKLLNFEEKIEKLWKNENIISEL